MTDQAAAVGSAGQAPGELDKLGRQSARPPTTAVSAKGRGRERGQPPLLSTIGVRVNAMIIVIHIQ